MAGERVDPFHAEGPAPKRQRTEREGDGLNPKPDVNTVGKFDSQGRLLWTPDLHDVFLRALEVEGMDNARPSSIQRRMSVRGLTLDHIKSHLQKYRVCAGLASRSRTTTGVAMQLVRGLDNDQLDKALKMWPHLSVMDAGAQAQRSRLSLGPQPPPPPPQPLRGGDAPVRAQAGAAGSSTTVPRAAHSDQFPTNLSDRPLPVRRQPDQGLLSSPRLPDLSSDAPLARRHADNGDSHPSGRLAPLFDAWYGGHLGRRAVLGPERPDRDGGAALPFRQGIDGGHPSPPTPGHVAETPPASLNMDHPPRLACGPRLLLPRCKGEPEQEEPEPEPQPQRGGVALGRGGARPAKPEIFAMMQSMIVQLQDTVAGLGDMVRVLAQELEQQHEAEAEEAQARQQRARGSPV